MGAAIMADLNRLFFLVAPFTLLINVAIGLFGPPPAASLSAMTPAQLFWQLALPSLVAAVGQLAVVALVLRPDAPPRAALGVAVAVWPGFMITQLLVSLPVGLGFLLVVPGIWLFGRLAFLPAALLVARRGSPIDAVRDSWAISEDDGLQLALFILLGLFAIIGISLIAEIAGAALDSVLKLAGLARVGRFLHLLLPGIGSCFITIGFGVASAIAYRRLVR
ncbi:MAG: hypothetical protein KGQ52_02430 [Alphaproteobacteria bacterium]|nr:hypothetical protein [Alphaproteobacteria bacterium]